MTDRTPHSGDPVEVAPAVIAGFPSSPSGPLVVPTAVQAAVNPTQVRRPWRSTLRTAWQAFLGLCVLAPILVQGAGLDPTKLPWLASALLVAAAVTRVMSIPAAETWLRRFLPFLAAAPAPHDRE